MKRRLLLFVWLVFAAFNLWAQISDTTAIKVRLWQQRMDNGATLNITVSNQSKEFSVFALQKNDSAAIFSSLVFDSAFVAVLNGMPTETGHTSTVTDETIGGKVTIVTDSVLWQQKVNLAATDSLLVKGELTILYKKGDEYLTDVRPVQFYIEPAIVNAGGIADKDATMVANKSLWWIFITAFGGGLLALLTPCVYSMIPITVSFFTKRSKTRAEGLRNALIYSVSIIIIFTLLGFAITLIFGPAALNNLATNWIANLLFFAVFILFGFSFLGAFDIQLPASWTNKADTKAGTSSVMGIFFMALTLVLVSFSCTGPIIGNLLVLAAKGSYYGPLVGMFGFSLALALPFALFAFFPSKLNMLGRAGGWLNAVKVTLGFLELALALKFFSNADLARGWRLLDREIFLGLWIAIFLLLALYLLGKIRFKHDDELPKNDYGLPHLTVTRLVFALTALFFACYMIPGLWGAPLKGISAFAPPMGTQDFTGSAAASHSSSAAAKQPDEMPQKYAEKMKMYEPEVVTKYGMVTYFDYNEALEAARKQKKPLMLDFTGINCVNCRKMEGQVWSDKQVMEKLKNDFIIVSLYVDVHNIDLHPSEQYFSQALGKQVTTLGDKNTDLQVSRFGANTQPYYFFLDADEKRIVPDGYGYDPDIAKFAGLLDEVVSKYKAGSE